MTLIPASVSRVSGAHGAEENLEWPGGRSQELLVTFAACGPF